MGLAQWDVVTSTCSHCGNRDSHERFRSIAGVWYRCGRCNYAWRGLGQSLAAVFARPHSDRSAGARAIDRDRHPRSGRLAQAQARAPRPVPAAPQRRPSSPAHVSGQRPAGAEHWLAGVEAGLAAGHPVTPGGSGATDPDGWTSGPRRLSERQVDPAPTVDADGNNQPDVLSDPAGDHRLAVEASPANVVRPLEDAQTSGEPRSELDGRLETTETLSVVYRDAAGGRRGERPVAPSGERSRVNRETSSSTTLQADPPASTVPIAVLMARVGDMDADLLRVGDALAKCEAAFLRLVRRRRRVVSPATFVARVY